MLFFQMNFTTFGDEALMITNQFKIFKGAGNLHFYALMQVSCYF